MDLASAGLKEQPFRTHGKPLVTIAYDAHNRALDMLRRSCHLPMGLALLQGPSLSGKSTLLREFVETVPDECSVALIDGAGLGTASLLEALLRKFGYLVDFNSTGELMAMLRVFVLQQASAHEAPIVIIENAHAMNPSAYRTLAEMAELRVRANSAIKLILASDRSLRRIIDAPAMEAISRRVSDDIHLRPIRREEAPRYLYEKLRAAGGEVPEFIFPTAVCMELWQASGGWPGILDRVALLALAKADSLPVGASAVERTALPTGTWDAQAIENAEIDAGEPPQPPTLYVTHNGRTIETVAFEKNRLLIGRSEHNDLSIDSRFVSRHHLLLVRSGNSTFMMDLNSTNGTHVNSRRVSNHMLIDDDVISIGHHRIKFSDPHAKRRGTLDTDQFADTAIMQTLEDMRALLARENTAALPALSEDFPTLGN